MTTSIKKGTHLVVGRTIYTHHGIYIGYGKVIHYSDDNGVEVVSLEQFRKGKQVRLRHYDKSSFLPNERVKRAKSRLGENDYNLVTNNCEHFATWVATGKHESEQVRNIASVSASGVSVYVARRIAISEVSKEAAKYVAKKAISKSLVNTALAVSEGSTAAAMTGLVSSGATGAIAGGATASALSSGATAAFATSLATPAAPFAIGAAIGLGIYYALTS